MTSILVSLEQDVLDFLKGAGKVAKVVELSVVQAAVAAAKHTTLGTLATSLIEIFDSHDMTGTQKMASVVGALIPAAETLIASGGLPAIEGAVEDFVREFAQSAYNDLQAWQAKIAANAAGAAVADLAKAA